MNPHCSVTLWSEETRKHPNKTPTLTPSHLPTTTPNTSTFDRISVSAPKQLLIVEALALPCYIYKNIVYINIILLITPQKYQYNQYIKRI